MEVVFVHKRISSLSLVFEVDWTLVGYYAGIPHKVDHYQISLWFVIFQVLCLSGHSTKLRSNPNRKHRQRADTEIC